MATLTDLQTQLAQVNAAITAVLTGAQEYRFNDGQIESWVKRGDLKELRLLKNELETQIADLEDDGGGFHAF